MKQLVKAFPEQLVKAIQISEEAKFTEIGRPFSNVLICGLGGSGIGGTIVSEQLMDQANVPVSVVKGYFIPAYINENSLVIISSYSGNTEETVQCMNQSIERKAKVVCITSGGRVKDIAEKNKLDMVLVPGGMPPRSCFGYSFVQLLRILNVFKITSSAFTSELKNTIKLLQDEQKNIISKASEVAKILKNKIPVIYTTNNHEGIAIRFRQQLNENSKILCWHHVFPEMNHNELVGWTERNNDLAVIMLRDEDDFKRNQLRFKLCEEVFKKFTDTIIEIYPKGSSSIEKAIYMIHLVDWISCELADERGVDPVEINVINHLKKSLAEA